MNAGVVEDERFLKPFEHVLEEVMDENMHSSSIWFKYLQL